MVPLTIAFILPVHAQVGADAAKSGSVTTGVTSGGSAPSETASFISPRLNVDIPDLKFSEAVINKEGEITSGFIGDYVGAMYKYLVGIATTVAIVMVMIGGLQYVMAAGSTDVSKAKTRIKNAVTGLVLLLSTYAILYVVNPNLVFFKNTTLDVIHVHDLPVFEHKPTKAESKIKVPPCKGGNKPSKNWGLGKVDNRLDNYACGSRDLSKVKYIVLHEGGRDGKTIPILAKRGLSTHYVIERDGTIIQSAGLEKRARHAGKINHWSVGIDLAIPKSNKKFGKYRGCSQSYSCAKDIECSSECFYTNGQYASLILLLSFISAKTGASYTDESIVSHCQIGGHSDVRNLDWKRLGLDQQKHRKNVVTTGCVKVDWAANVGAKKK